MYAFIIKNSPIISLCFYLGHFVWGAFGQNCVVRGDFVLQNFGVILSRGILVGEILPG